MKRILPTNQETCILQFFIYGVCYWIKIRPQQSTPKCNQFLTDNTQKEAPFNFPKASKDNKPTSSLVDSKTKVKTKPKCNHMPKQDHLLRRARTRKRPKKAGSYKASILRHQPNLPPILRTPKRIFARICNRD